MSELDSISLVCLPATATSTIQIGPEGVQRGIWVTYHGYRIWYCTRLDT